MNLKQLEVFLAVAETGSFSRGAEATFITQSTVSQHISALEKELGIRLLDRTSKGALLTEGGKVLVRHAQRVITATREIALAVDRFKGVEDATLRIGGSNIPGDYMIPAALPLFLQRYPGVHLILLQGDSHDIIDRIAREEMEVGIVGGQFAEEGVSFTPLGRDDLKLTVGSSHPWNDKKLVSLEELADEDFILREPGSGTGKTIEEALTTAGFDSSRLKIRACLGSNEAIKQAVASGLGISFLSDISVRKEISRGELAEVEVAGLAISRHFHLARRVGRDLSPAATAFVAVMTEMFGNEV